VYSRTFRGKGVVKKGPLKKSYSCPKICSKKR
jgi:hypothetical protein